MSTYLRRTWAEVDIHAIKHNFDVIRRSAADNAQIMCVIKADAYGHGAVIEEAMQLRDNGIQLPVLILGFTPANLAKVLADHHISQAVFSEEYAKELSDFAVRENVNVNIHIKLDTGMSRIGFMYQNIERDSDSVEEIKRVCQLPNLISEGIFTHFAVSDEGEEGREATLHQLACFTEVCPVRDKIPVLRPFPKSVFRYVFSFL